MANVFRTEDPHRRAVEMQREIHAAEEFNPWRSIDLGAKGSETTAELPGRTQNVRWQMRQRTPTAYEELLADCLGKIYTDGVWDLPGIVARLSAAGLKTPAGDPWTEDNFEAEITRLEASL